MAQREMRRKERKEVGRYAAIVVEAPVPAVYHYRVPADFASGLCPGCRVQVPFGRRMAQGFCVELLDATPLAEDRLKDIAAVGAAEESIPPDVMALARWVARYYRCGWGIALAACMPAAIRSGRKSRQEIWISVRDAARAREALPAIAKKSRAQAALLRWLLDNAYGAVAWRDAQAALSASLPVLRRLAAADLIVIEARAPQRETALLPPAAAIECLTPGQDAALQRISAGLAAGKFAAFLLYGVTGSGKTEVYVRAVQQALAQGRSALVLVPEISLTPQTVNRFRRVAADLEIWHSQRSDAERAAAWRRIRRGETRLVIGTRSAVFAPLSNLGLVIIDEEHDRSFKQESEPRYHGRDTAMLRARESGAVAVLGSATPSLETYQNALDGKYTLLPLPERATGASLPQVHLVDMRQEWTETKQTAVLSRFLVEGLRACHGRGEQAILLLNRRGFHTQVRCRQCGEVLGCGDCAVALIYHRRQGLLRCHYCGRSQPVPNICPLCGHRGWRFWGAGTERLEHVLAAMLPGVRLLRMDSDTMTGRDVHGRALAAFARREYDILLGTQMVAFGLDFPHVTLVGVVLADEGLDLPDFRAAERVFQLVTQVVGRAGRAERPGQAVIQAFRPDHFAVQCALRQDHAGFAARELASRKAMGYPPFGRLARIVARARDPEASACRLVEIAKTLRSAAPRPGMILGPAPCPLERLEGEWRHHILVKCRNHTEVAHMLDCAAPLMRERGGVRLSVDVDPLSLL